MGHTKAVKILHEDIANLLDLLHLSHEAIICVGIRHDIVVFNNGAEQIFGYKRNEIIGRPLNCLIPDRFHKAHTANVDKFKLGKSRAKLMAQREPVTALRKNGEEFTAHASISKFEYGGETTMTVVLHETENR
jgi:PAS domain S-box-containing protein